MSTRICPQCKGEVEDFVVAPPFCSVECEQIDRTGLDGLALAIYLYVESHEGAGGVGVPEEELLELAGSAGIEYLVGGFEAGDLRWALRPVVTDRDRKGRVKAIDGGNVRTGRAWEKHTPKDVYVPPLER
jgi:hypothetical protein